MLGLVALNVAGSGNYAHAIADIGADSETKANTDYCSAGSAYTETDVKAMQSCE